MTGGDRGPALTVTGGAQTPEPGAQAMPVVDTFIRERLSLDTLRALPVGRMLLLSTAWSTFQALQPVRLLQVSDGGYVEYVSLVPGHPDWPAWIDLREGRFYLAS